MIAAEVPYKRALSLIARRYRDDNPICVRVQDGLEPMPVVALGSGAHVRPTGVSTAAARVLRAAGLVTWHDGEGTWPIMPTGEGWEALA